MSPRPLSLLAVLRKPRHLLMRVLRWALLGLAGLWFVLLAAWLTLHWAILPKLDTWRPEIEAAATEALRDSGGARLSIGELKVTSGGWMPVVSLRDLRLIDAQGAIALHLPQASAQLSARSLLAWPPRLEQIYLHEPALQLRRDAQGQLWLAGIRLPDGQAGSEPSPASDFLLRQHEIAIRNARLSWVNEADTAEPLQLTQVDLLLKNSLRTHELRVDATPPAPLGQRFTLRGRLTQPLFARAGDWRRWSGQLYAELPQAQAEGLSRHLPLPPQLQLSQGAGSLRAWGELARGELQALTVDLGLQALQLRLSPRLQPLALQTLDGRLGWQRLPDGSRWSLRGLQFRLPADGGDGSEAAEAAVWPAGNATLDLQHTPGPPWQALHTNMLRGGQLQAERVDLGLLARVAESLPLGEALHRPLRERAPRGVVQSLELRWSGALDAPAQWRAAGSAQQLAWMALPAVEPSEADPHPLGEPGLSGASLRFSATQQGGEARLQLREGAIDYPGLLDGTRLAVTRADAELRWQRGADARWQLEGRQLALDIPGVRASGHLTWKQTERPGGELDLQLKSPQLALPALPSLLPLVLNADVRQYLQDALQGGMARALSMQLKGPLADFPFRQTGSGVFRVQAQLQDARFAFVPSHPARNGQAAYESPWPAFEGLNGQLTLDGPGLRIASPRARIGGLEVSEIDARIADMGRERVLRVGGRWRGDGATALAFVRATPVAGWTAGALAQARVEGAAPVTGSLQLTLPLQDLTHSQVRGSVQLGTAQTGLQLRLRDDLPPFADLRGGVDFSERGLQLKALTARFLGGPVRVGGGSREGDGALLVEASGQASADGLRAATREWPGLAALAPSLSGQADYQLRLAFREAAPELELKSTLQGLASSLPAPLAKGAAESWPLLLRVQPQGDGREAWGLSLGQVAQALLEREGVRTRRGVIRIGPGDMSLPPDGLLLAWSAPQIDLDPWRARLAGGSGGEQPGGLPDRVQLDTPLLRVAQRRFTQVSLSAQQQPARQAWALQWKSEQGNGDIEWRTPVGQPPALQARFARLVLPPEEAGTVAPSEAGSASGASSEALPTIDLEVQDFQLRGKKLGRLELKAVGAPSGRDWALQTLALTHPDARLTASGLWRAAERRTQLDWQLAIDNSGRWLDALGFTNTVRGGKGQLKGQLSWKGSPLSPGVAGLDGQFSLKLEDGQFLRADPGVARLLGILSLQSLARRLFFDWRDVFGSGFAFDEFAGDVTIAQGVARSSNLRMRGIQASVLMDGSADLRAETTELRVLVVPELDAGGAALAYATVNPAVGLTTFLAQLLLKKPIAAANTTQLRVSGPWADPKVEKLEKTSS